MDTLSAPSRNLIMKCWHEICRQTHFSVRPRRSHSSVPTAVQLRRRVERRSRMAATWRPPAGLVLDGREHGGRLRQAGANDDQHRFPLPLPVPPYSSREAEAGSPSVTVLAASSKSVILLTGRLLCRSRLPHWRFRFRRIRCWTERLRRERRTATAAWIADRQEYPIRRRRA